MLFVALSSYFNIKYDKIYGNISFENAGS